MRRWLMPILVFGATIAVALTVFVIFNNYPSLFSKAYALRIATGPLSSEGGKFVGAFRRELAAAHPRISVEMIETPSIAASALALKSGDADLAVVRRDDPNAAESRSIFVLRNLAIAILVPAQSSADKMSDLAGERIGVVTSGGQVDPLARAVLGFYDIDDKRIVPLAPAALGEAIVKKHIHAAIVVGPMSAGPIAEAIQVFRKATKKPPKFIDLDEADAIIARYPVYEKLDVPRGAFGGSPAAPDDDVSTVATTVLLVARPSLSNYAAGELTRLLLATKTGVASTLPDAGQLAAPSTDRDVVLPAHPGTIDYLNGDTPNLLDETMNYIYYASMFAGVLGAVGAWAASLGNRRRIRELRVRIDRLPTLLEEAKTQPAHRLAAAEQELNELSDWFSERFIADEISADMFNTASTRVAHLRELLSRRLNSEATSRGPDGSIGIKPIHTQRG